MNSQSKAEPRPIDIPEWVSTVLACVIGLVLAWLLIGFLDTVSDPIQVNSAMQNLTNQYSTRTAIATDVSQFLKNNKLADTTTLDTAIRETERAQMYLDREGITQETFRLYEKQYSDLDTVLDAVYKLKDGDKESSDAELDLKSRLAQNAVRITQARLEYNKQAIEFNTEYTTYWPERYMRRTLRFVLPEKESVGPEFAGLYGTPAPK